MGGVCGRWDQAHKDQVGTLQATGLLFRPLVHGVCLDLASAVGALLPCMYSVVALRPEALCY